MVEGRATVHFADHDEVLEAGDTYYRAPGHVPVVEAGTVLGHGTLVASHSRVRGRFPDFAVLAGSPATVVGDTREPDRAWLAAHPQLRDGYEAWLRSVAAEAKT